MFGNLSVMEDEKAKEQAEVRPVEARANVSLNDSVSPWAAGPAEFKNTGHKPFLSDYNSSVVLTSVSTLAMKASNSSSE